MKRWLSIVPGCEFLDARCGMRDSDRIYRMNMMDTILDDPHLILTILFILSNFV
jgi:hypothetical protein